MKQIPLTQGKFSLVDDDVYEWASKFKWYAMKNNNVYYTRRRISIGYKKYINVLLHHCVIGFPLFNNEVDHLNGDGLNNQRDNLKIVTHRQNQQNRHVKKTSKYVGVFWDSQNKKWRASIKKNGKVKFLGLFKIEEDASLAYQKALQDILKIK